MKEKVDQNLYFVEKILRLEKINGQMYAIVKWENYGYKQTTRQSLQSLKINPQLRVDIQKMEAEFQIRHQAKALAHQIEQYTESYLKQLYNEGSFQAKDVQENIQASDKPASQNLKLQQDSQRSIYLKLNKSHGKIKEQLTPHQLAICNVKAKNKIKQRLKYGLANFRPKQYFELQQILYDVRAKIQKDFKYELPKTDLVVQQVKGFYIQGNQYKFCVCVQEKIIVVPLCQMMQLFPQNLLNFLTKFLRYARQIMSQQIKREEQLIANKRYKARAVETVSKMLNIRQHIESNKKVVYFGRDQEDVEVNMKLHLDRFLGKDKSSQKKNDKQNTKKSKKEGEVESFNLTEELKLLHDQIERQINSKFRIDKSPNQKSFSFKSKKSQRISPSNSRSHKTGSKEKKNAISEENISIKDSQSAKSFRAKKQQAAGAKKAKEGSSPEPQLRRSKRLSSRSVTAKSASRNSQQLSSQSQIESSLSIGGQKRKRKSSDKQLSGKKKLFKND